MVKPEPTSDPYQIKVRVLFFGAARDAAGHSEVDLSLHAPTDAANAFEQVLSTYPELRRFGRSLLFALNQEYAPKDREVHDGDELALFPPVSGGSEGDRETAGGESGETGRRGDGAIGVREDSEIGESVNAYPGSAGVSPASTLEIPDAAKTAHDFFELTTDPLDVGSIARRVVLPECGATVTLDGYARKWTRGRETLYLVYEAYPPMAMSEMHRLGREAHEQFEIAHIGMVHRTGRLEIGETSVVITVSAPHRQAAFAACEWAIRELKRTVPIWKKEVFEDGEVWVEGEGAPAAASID